MSAQRALPMNLKPSVLSTPRLAMATTLHGESHDPKPYVLFLQPEVKVKLFRLVARCRIGQQEETPGSHEAMQG
ncbi:MAG TPA: hypothetical protein DCE41_12955 [Cytophagales bacterium]|nr:hypothetical protein [Cytophagales bacterium]